MKKSFLALPLVAMVAACGGSGGSSGAGDINIVGSSTVYPFTTAVSEQFERANPGTRVKVESTGTGSGMKLFCAGVGQDHPDVVNASRRMKASEFEMCQEAGVTDIVEIAVGIDGLTLIQAVGDDSINLTVEDIYKALAANPYGEEQTAVTWNDVNPDLPALKIDVLGPPPTSGTRDSFAELILEAGCDANPAMEELKAADKDQHKTVCTKIREDGVFVEAGENDNLLVQKVSESPGRLGVLGYSFLEENADKVKAVSIGGVSPNEDTISSLDYPGARLLYIYVKKQHADVKPSLADFVSTYAAAWEKGGLLNSRGLVPLAGDDLAKANATAADLSTLDGSEL